MICDAAQLQERGKGFKFTVERYGRKEPAFVIRFSGTVYGYLNRCAHVPVELDWTDGEFFDMSGLYLICSTHGATYLPESGHCIAGPCSGRSLIRLPVDEIDGQVFLKLES